MNNRIIQPGVSGREPKFTSQDVNLDVVANELALLQLGDFESLKTKINTEQFMQEIKKFAHDWIDYLPRTDRPNNRQSLLISQLPGKSFKENPSLAQASQQAGYRLSENNFNTLTDVYYSCPSLHPLLNDFLPLGRTFLIKSNIGGYFVPHRDHPSMPRECFRIAVFLNNCAPLEYDWILETDKKLPIELGRAYYINTRKTHRTISWVNDSIHLIINVPFTSENVSRLIAKLQHSH